MRMILDSIRDERKILIGMARLAPPFVLPVCELTCVRVRMTISTSLELRDMEPDFPARIPGTR